MNTKPEQTRTLLIIAGGLALALSLALAASAEEDIIQGGLALAFAVVASLLLRSARTDEER